MTSSSLSSKGSRRNMSRALGMFYYTILLVFYYIYVNIICYCSIIVRKVSPESVMTDFDPGRNRTQPVVCGPTRFLVVSKIIEPVAVPVQAQKGKKPDRTGPDLKTLPATLQGFQT